MEVFVIWTLHRWATLLNIRRFLQEFNWNKVMKIFEKIDILFIDNIENKIRYIKHKILICKQNSWNEHSSKAIVNICIVSCYARGVLNWIELTIANKFQCYLKYLYICTCKRYTAKWFQERKWNRFYQYFLKPFHLKQLNFTI